MTTVNGSKCFSCYEPATHWAFIDGCAEQKVCETCANEFETQKYGMYGIIGKIGECPDLDELKSEKALYAERKKKYLRGIINAIKDKPCQDCGGLFSPDLLTFDHLPRFPKEMDINDAIRKKSFRALLSEAVKCEIVCRPCHDKREIKRERDKKFTVILFNWAFSSTVNKKLEELGFKHLQPLVLNRRELMAIVEEFFENDLSVALTKVEAGAIIYLDEKRRRPFGQR